MLDTLGRLYVLHIKVDNEDTMLLVDFQQRQMIFIRGRRLIRRSEAAYSEQRPLLVKTNKRQKWNLLWR